MSDLEVMKRMVDEDKDIRATTTLTEMKKVKKGGKMTFGIDDKTYHDISKAFALNTGEYYVIAYIVNAKEFEEIKKQNV